MKTEEAFVMNKARKLCALVLSVAMVLTMGLASFAENPEEQTPVATTEEQQTPVTTTENETETTPGEEPEQDEEQPQQTVLPITVDFNWVLLSIKVMDRKDKQLQREAMDKLPVCGIKNCHNR